MGNTYDVVLADCIARYKRMMGFEVYFLTGSDEHGQKIEQYAEERGISPKAYVDGISGQIRAVWDKMNTTYDKFIRTTDGYHEKAVQAIFKKLYDQGDIYKSQYEGKYCVPCESFFTASQLKGRHIVVVANLKPAVLCGVESQGMILAADDGDAARVLFVDGVAPGSKVR